MSERLNLGVDFGTSNSSVGTVVDKNVVLFDLDKGRVTQPSSIFIRVDGYHSTGYPAIEDYLDPNKKNDSYHFLPTVKPGLPLDYYEGNVLRSIRLEDGKYPTRFFPIEELASYVLSDLKSKAEKQSGEISTKAVLGRPVVFSDNPELDKLAQSRLEKAANIAGFKEVHFLLEPVAAALYYERTTQDSDRKKVFVFDFGGGTLDTCILDMKPNEKLNSSNLNARILSSHGIDLGGTDLDKDLFEKWFLPYFGEKITYGTQNLGMPRYIYLNLPEWHLASQLDKPSTVDFIRQIANDSLVSDRDAVKRLITLIKDQQVFALLQSIEQSKIDISREENGVVDFHFKEIDLKRDITRKEFEGAINFRKRQIKECITECLNKAQMQASGIDLVLRVGGSSNNPFVGKMLAEIFKTVEEVEPFTSVVAGLSLAANELFE